jgi:hypothetical protein
VAVSPQPLQSDSQVTNGKTLSRLAVGVPFVLSSALYLSALFKIFACLPLVFLHLRFGRWIGLAASIGNMGLVWLISGKTDAAWYFVFALSLGWVLAEFIHYRIKIEWQVLAGVVVMAVSGAALFVGYAQKVQENPVALVKSFVGAEVDDFVRNAEKYKGTGSVSSQDFEKMLVDPEVTKQNLMDVLPSATAISLLLLAVVNALLALKLNLAGMRQRFGHSLASIRDWKAPDHMVWPTLLAGFCLIVEIPAVSSVALTVFRVLMAVYGLQGLAILSGLLDSWGLRGVLRPLIFVMAITFLLPLVLSLGFFDLWFDFRQKFKAQTKTNNKPR